jgi:hypothetical protein
MGLAFATTIALCIWVALWAIGVKALDGMILALLIIVVTAAVKILTSHLTGHTAE